MIDRPGLAGFLRTRRHALQPEDVGMPRGQRRRTVGLRREEVAALCHMSTDYYSRLERERGPQPSVQMLASIAQGLHLSRDERDHLFRLAGHQAPARGRGTDHISPGVLRIFDRLTDTPAEVVTELGETLRQTPLGVALVGDLTRFTGPARSLVVRFREFWAQHEVGLRPREIKRYQHPGVGLLELTCQILLDPEQSHALLVYTAVPGSESHEKLQLLSVVGSVGTEGSAGSAASGGSP